VEATDAADQIREAAEDEEATAERKAIERFRITAAIVIAILAMLLAIASLGGDNSTKETLNANIQVTDTWAFYQAKNIRQTANQLAANELEAQLLLHGGSLSEADRQSIQQRIDGYRATAVRYESEPDPNDPTDPLKGEGKKELMAKAQHWEGVRDHALQQDPNFDYATALLQIAIVLASVSIIAVSRPILIGSIVVGALGFILTLNGYFLFFDLPIG
jgi:hypothetical protein